MGAGYLSPAKRTWSAHRASAGNILQYAPVSTLATGIRYDPDDPRRGDLNLWKREIKVRGKGGRPRVVRISHEATTPPRRWTATFAPGPVTRRPGASSCGPERVAGGR